MSDISISTMTISSMALDSQLDGAASMEDSSSTVISGINKYGPDSSDQTIAGAQVASRTTEFFGSGTDLGSTGTDIDVQQTINSTLMSGNGSITNKII